MHTLISIIGMTLLSSMPVAIAVERYDADPKLERIQTKKHDLVTLQRPGSNTATVLLSLPRTKWDYSPAEYESATVAVKAVTKRLQASLKRYGAYVWALDDNGTPMILVTMLAEHMQTVLPIISHHWYEARFTARDWHALLAQESRDVSDQNSDEKALKMMLGRRSSQAIEKLTHDPLRFDRSRTMLIVGSPLAANQVLQILKDKPSPYLSVKPAIETKTYIKPSAADCVFAAGENTITRIFLPLQVDAVSSDNWPVTRVAIAIAGTGFESRLYQELRTKRGWAYGAGIPMEFHPAYSVGMTTTRVTADKAQAAAQLLKDVLGSLQTSPVSELEVSSAKEFLREKLRDIREQLIHEVPYLADFLNAGMSIDQFSDYANSLGAVTASDVHAFVKGHPVSTWADKAYAVKDNGSLCRLPLF